MSDVRAICSEIFAQALERVRDNDQPDAAILAAVFRFTPYRERFGSLGDEILDLIGQAVDGIDGHSNSAAVENLTSVILLVVSAPDPENS